MARVFGKVAVVFALVAAVLVVTALVMTLRTPGAAMTVMPNPNGYDDLLKAAGLLNVHSWTNQEGLKNLVASNAEALQLARIGLGQECRVPLDYSITNFSSHKQSALERLMQAFAAEGEVFELENKPSEAAQSYLA